MATMAADSRIRYDIKCMAQPHRAWIRTDDGQHVHPQFIGLNVDPCDGHIEHDFRRKCAKDIQRLHVLVHGVGQPLT
jgi:hypothetical protein